MASFSMVLLLGTLLIRLLTDPALFVDGINLGGAALVPGEEIYAESGVARQHIFWVNPVEVQEKVAAIPGIASATINVKWPDVIEPVNGGEGSLQYAGVPGATAGVVYKGLFPGGTRGGGVAVFGFPLESVYPESARDSLFARMFSYFATLLGIEEVRELLPESTELLQNYPNPFNPLTRIELRIQNSEFLILKVMDQLGREVATLLNEQKSPGHYAVEFDGRGLASGVYYVRLQSGDFAQTRRMLLLR